MANLSTSVSSTSSVTFSNGNSRHQLDNLPDLVNDNLFKYLHLDDIWQLRLINKRFYYIITNDFKIIQLLFTNYFFYGYGNWFSTTKPIGFRNLLDESKLPMIFNPSNNLLNLKYLKIILDNYCPIKVDDLNKFTKLQILMICGEGDSLEGSIDLPDLKALDIYSDVYSGIKPNLIVDTPNLHSLSIFVSNNSNVIDDLIKFKNPQSVKYLQLYHYDKKISIFDNLECLEFFGKFNTVVDGLSMFKNLKKLRINDVYPVNINELRDLFRSKRDDLEVVLHGVKIKEINKLDEYENRRSDLEYQLANYGELEDEQKSIFSMNYSELVDLLPKNQPSDLFKKYNNIQCMRINRRIEDENRLIHFIKECPNLEYLFIRGSSLSQQFYDQLPVISSLSVLDIYEDDIELNFEFLMKMTYLSRFTTDQDVQTDENLNLNSLKYLKEFQFRIKNENEIIIEKEGRDRYKITKCKHLNKPDQEYFSLDEITQWINNLRDNEI